MPRVENWIIERLLGDGDVVALMADRVNPIYVPQGESRPSVTIRREKTSREYSNLGNTGAPEAQFSILCSAEDYLECGLLAVAVRLALESQLEDVEAYQIQGVFVLDEYDDEAPPMAAEGEPLYGVRLVVAINHTEPTRS